MVYIYASAKLLAVAAFYDFQWKPEAPFSFLVLNSTSGYELHFVVVRLHRVASSFLLTTRRAPALD